MSGGVRRLLRRLASPFGHRAADREVQDELATHLANSQFLSATNHGHNDLPLDLQGPYGPQIAAFLAP